jgi:hypothetical protein
VINGINLQVEWWHLVGLALSLFGGFWVLIKLMVAQFVRGLDKRFDIIEKDRVETNQLSKERFDRFEEMQRTTERDLLSLRAELPDRYVRREDAIRSEMTLHAKFDGLAGRIDMFMRGTQQ